MRYIDQSLKDKILLAQQTIYNNANPQMEIVAVRPRTAIFHERFWQESIVTEGVTAVCTSVAIKRVGRWGETVFVAYVDSNGTLTVKSAPLRFPIRAMSWTTVETIANCSACSLEFEGHFVHIGRNVEFRTLETPYLAYVDSSGALFVGILGDTYEQIAAANVTAVDMINGVSNTYDAQDQGFFVFYIVDSTVYYNTYFDGAWEGQRAVSIAPANAVSLKAERTFDWRIVLQVTDNTGALYEIFTKMEATGWNSTEFIDFVDATLSVSRTRVYYTDTANEDLAITFAPIGIINPGSIFSPQMLEAYNYPNESGDYGYKINLRWDERVYGSESNLSAFKLTDSLGVIWNPASITRTDYTLNFTFGDFNNAVNPVTLSYTPGTLSSGVVPVNADSIQFDLTGLVPTFVPPPVPVSIINIIDWGEW